MLEDVLVIRAAPEVSLPNPAPRLAVLFTYNKHCQKFGVLGSQTELLHVQVRGEQILWVPGANCFSFLTPQK